MSINFNSLQYFRVLAQMEHYTRAAEALHITQPALSKSMSALEAEFGIKLFERDGRNIRLTSYGKLLYDYIERGIHEFEEGFSKLHGMSSADSGEIILGLPPYPGAREIPAMITGFSRKYPNITLRIYQFSTQKIIEKLRRGELDIGVCSDFSTLKDIDTDDLTQVPLCSCEFAFVVPESSPLAKADALSIEDVADRVFIGYNEDVLTGSNAIFKMMSHGLRTEPACFVSDGFLLLALVSSGLGIGIVPRSDFQLDGVVSVRAKRPFLMQSFFLTWNTKRFIPAAAETFKRYALSREWE